MDYLQAWTNALSGAMSQSYKPIVALTIFDLAKEEISVTDFVDRLSEFFWQLERRFNLKMWSRLGNRNKKKEGPSSKGSFLSTSLGKTTALIPRCTVRERPGRPSKVEAPRGWRPDRPQVGTAP